MQSGRKRVTAILTRRVKQGVAEWHVLETLEKSWDGFVEHAHQGYNVGRPPYGYVADKISHPVPVRLEQGKVTTRLIPDPVRANVVKLIYDLYLNTGMGLLLIRDHLNADPASYPPPTPPDPGGAWLVVDEQHLGDPPEPEIHRLHGLESPGTKGRQQPNQPHFGMGVVAGAMHEPLISMDDFQAVQAKATVNERSRRHGGEDQEAAPERKPRTVYLYRGPVRCGMCGMRMTGNRLAGRVAAVRRARPATLSRP